MMNCKRATELVSEHLDHPLPLSQRVALKTHLLMCRHCARFAKQVRYIRDAVRQFPEDDDAEDAPTMTDEAKDRLRETLKGYEPHHG